MSRPTLCIIHEGIGDYNAIAKIAKGDAECALDAGWAVTVVAKRLDEELQKKVEWLQLHVPSRVYLYKWLTARHYIRKALGGRSFDIIHAHQPQVADLADVFDCHYLSRMSHQRGCKDNRPGLRGVIMRMQERGILFAEDYFYRRWNPRTHMLFDSNLTRDDFTGLYRRPPSSEVLLCPLPPLRVADPAERAAARASFFGNNCDLPVVGFLGGSIHRKGVARLIAASAAEPELLFLIGGSGSEQLPATDRFKPIGLVSELDHFYAACDVLIVPSLYEPFGLVVFEALARGTPVITTPEVGALPHLLEHGVGASWKPGTPLLPVVQEVLLHRDHTAQAVKEMEQTLGRAAYAQRLMATYEKVLKAKNAAIPNLSAVGAGA